MTDKLLRKLKRKVSFLALAPFEDGRFEVFVDGRRIYSKLETGQFPDDDALLAEIGGEEPAAKTAKA